MTHDEQVKHLNTLLLTMMRIRSIMAESGEVDEYFAPMMWPYIYGKKNITAALAKVLDSDIFDTQTFVNFIYVATVLEPAIGIIAGTYDTHFPSKIDINWLRK